MHLRLIIITVLRSFNCHVVLHTLLIVEDLLFGPHSLVCAAERPWKLAILRVGLAEKSTLIFYQTHQNLTPARGNIGVEEMPCFTALMLRRLRC